MRDPPNDGIPKSALNQSPKGGGDRERHPFAHVTTPTNAHVKNQSRKSKRHPVESRENTGLVVNLPLHTTMLYRAYLGPEVLRGFEGYKYSCRDTSPLSNYVMHPFWNQVR